MFHGSIDYKTFHYKVMYTKVKRQIKTLAPNGNL